MTHEGGLEVPVIAHPMSIESAILASLVGRLLFDAGGEERGIDESTRS